MHFFSPAKVMPLLEVVRTSKSAPDVIRTVMDLSRPLRKTPVLARVCYGFIGNRMMEGYAREAEFMVLEGATPRQVDSVLENWGMAMGILAVFDMAGIEVGVSVHKVSTASRKFSSAASIRCSTKASASWKKASQYAQATSTWYGLPGMGSRGIEAGRSSTPAPSA